MLSNIITGNEALISNLWETYLNLQEDQVILMYVNFAGMS